jgi:L-fuculose-phosphate aldolase
MNKERKEIFHGRHLIAKVGALMFDRNLTDLAGGNISMRIGDKVLMSPSFAGTYHFWNIKPEDVLVLTMDGKKIDGKGEISRESPMHLKLLNSFYPVAKAVIHAHPLYTQVFCASQQPIPPVLEGNMRYGLIKCAKFANGGSHSEELAENIYQAFEGQTKLIEEYAAAVLAPWHGIVCAGRDIYSVVDTIERIDVNAHCILLGQSLLPKNEWAQKAQLALIEAMGKSNSGE